MTPDAVIRTVDGMLKLTHKRRTNYLRELAAEPLFRGVPKHLMPAIARSVDVLELAPGSVLACDPAREAVILTTSARCVVISRRELPSVLRIAPAVATAIGNR